MENLRGGLVNFIGLLLSQSGLTGKAARHSVVSLLTEESLKLAQNEEDNNIDLYCVKPILRATSFILSQRIKLLRPLSKDENVKNKIRTYELIVKELNSLIDSTKL